MKKSKKRKKSNYWKVKQNRDQFFKKSKILGFRSRAAFKLIELDKKYKFIRYWIKPRWLVSSCKKVNKKWKNIVSRYKKNGSTTRSAFFAR